VYLRIAAALPVASSTCDDDVKLGPPSFLRGESACRIVWASHADVRLIGRAAWENTSALTQLSSNIVRIWSGVTVAASSET